MFKKYNLFNTSKVILIIFLSVLPYITFADPGDPCTDTDPITNDCPVPLDTYVWLLVIAAAIFGAIYLHRQQQRVQGRV